MRYILFSIGISLAVFLLVAGTAPVQAAPPDVPKVGPLPIPSYQITSTCAVTWTWSMRQDNGSNRATWTSLFDQASMTGWQYVTFSEGNWANSLWHDVFTVTGMLTGSVITVRSWGVLPTIEWGGGDRQPPTVVCYTAEGAGEGGTRIDNGTVVLTATQAFQKCKVGHFFGVEGREDAAYFETGSAYSWSYAIQVDGVCLNECGTPGIITNTHFILNEAWTAGGATWSRSLWDIAPGGSIYQTGSFPTAGQYSMTVRVMGIGSDSIDLSLYIGDQVSIEPVQMINRWVTKSALFTVTGGSKIVGIGLGAGEPNDVIVDQVCIYLSTSSVPVGNCINADPHFVNQLSWTPFTSADTVWYSSDSHGGNGLWAMGTWASIRQPILPTAMPSGQYTITLLLRALNATRIGFDYRQEEPLLEWNVPGGGDYSFYSGVFSVTESSTPFVFLVSNRESGVGFIDYLCVSRVMTSTPPLGTGPCQITARDMSDSSLYFVSNQSFENNIGGNAIDCTPFPDVSFSFPLGVNVGMGQSCLEPLPAIISLNSWARRPGSVWQSYYGALRSGQYNYSVGVIPSPLTNGISQQIGTPSRITNGFNVVFRAFRTYDNARIIVNTDTYFPPGASAAAGAWGDYNVWLPNGTTVSFASDCGGNICAPRPGQSIKTPDSVVIDDVYVVPGPSLCAGGSSLCLCSDQPPTPPPGDCINTLGDADWRTVGQSSIESSTTGKWAIIPINGAIERYVPVSTSANSWQEANAMLSSAMSATVLVDARCQNTSAPCGITIYGNASTGDQSYTTAYFGCSGNMACSGIITHTFNPVGSNSMIRIANTGEAQGGETWTGTTLVSRVCINRGSAPPVVPGGCLGVWRSSLTDVEVGPGIEIPYEYNAYNSESTLSGSYTLNASGSFMESPDITPTITLMYADGSRQEIIQSSNADSPDFGVSYSFVTPPGGYSGGRLILQGTHDLEYASVCLKAGGTTPPGPIAPFPSCFQNGTTTTWINSGVLFPPYTSTSTSSIDPANAAMLIYNYAIYPLGCEILYIADKEISEFNRWMLIIEEYLFSIERLLREILDLLGQTPPACGLFDVIAYIIKKLFELLGLILSMIGRMLQMVLEILNNISVDLRTGQPTSYPIECDEEGQYMCLILGGLIAIERLGFGEWLNVMAFIGVTMLTIPLGLWVVDQTRAMLQPGSGGSNAE